MNHLLKFLKVKNKIKLVQGIIILQLNSEVKVPHAGHKLNKNDGMIQKIILILDQVHMI
jgi:hypothetical protein